jgi:hypothetical protein
MNTGLVFGIIFAIIIIAMLLVFGLEQIVNIFCISNIAQTDKAAKDLEHEVENVYNLAEGSMVPFKVAIPRNAKLCLIDPDDPSPQNSWVPHPDLYDSMKYEIENKRYNVWLIYGCGTNDKGYKINYLETTENFCVKGGTELYVENKGYHVAIERPVGA